MPRTTDIEVLAVAKQGTGTVVHTTAGRLFLSDEALKKFGFHGDSTLTDYNRCSAEECAQRNTAHAIKAVALMLKERLSLFAACERLGVSYASLHRAITNNPDLGALVEGARQASGKAVS